MLPWGGEGTRGAAWGGGEAEDPSKATERGGVMVVLLKSKLLLLRSSFKHNTRGPVGALLYKYTYTLAVRACVYACLSNRSSWERGGGGERGGGLGVQHINLDPRSRG